MKSNRDIITLTDAEHVRLRSEIYCGSIIPIEEKIPIIENNRLILKTKVYSVGLYKLFEEVIDNCLDEAKRCFYEKIVVDKIIVRLNTQTNEIEISDSGLGFKNADKINNKSKLTNVETALTQLRAGSNFKNDDVEVNLIGTNGVGVSIVNILSEKFSVLTINENIVYHQEWSDFKTTKKKITERTQEPTGTTIKFIPSKEIFKDQTWDLEILRTKLILKNFLKNNSYLKKTELEFYVDDVLEDIDINFLPKHHLAQDINKKDFQLFLWPTYDNSTSLSFINDSLCTGLHQKVINETINSKIFEYERAHHFYESLVILNLQPKYVKFGDQNKTKFVTNRSELNKFLKFDIKSRDLRTYKQSQFFKEVKENIELSLQRNELNKVKRAKKENRIKISDKFYSSKKKSQLFITEGLSALGSINVCRNPMTQATYALKGKIKNARDLTDLSENIEIMELMNICNLRIDDKGESCSYEKIVISVDADEDGSHIASLLMNLFYKWFPKVVTNGKLYILRTPLVSIDIKNKRKYFYSLEDFGKSEIKTSVRYLKGLGSLDIRDWNYVFSNLSLIKIKNDSSSQKYLEMAFGDDSNLRKSFLQLI